MSVCRTRLRKVARIILLEVFVLFLWLSINIVRHREVYMAVSGPGLGYYGDFASFNNNKFSGIKQAPQGVAGPGLGTYGDFASFNNQGKFTGIQQFNNPYGSSGSVLGSSTSSGGSSGGGGDSYFQQLSKMDRNPSQESEYQNLLAQMSSAEDQQKSSINAGWDSYIGQLNDMLNVGLPGQMQAQQGMANTSYQQGVNTLQGQKTSSEQSLESQKTKSLKDLSENVMNLFQSGNVYLGARGAGDSSAANQYSYALTKMGSKARGDIMTQANDRLNQIGDIYNSEINRLDSEKNMRLAEISNWFNEAQNQIRQNIGQAGLGRQRDLQALSQNAYNTALQALQMLQTESSNRRGALESWALSNSRNVQELLGNMRAVQSMPAFGGLQNGMPNVTPEGQPALFGYGTQGTQDDNIFNKLK